MATFDYDVVIIGSGFGGSVPAFRAAEKGYGVRVTTGAVMDGPRDSATQRVRRARGRR